MGIEDGERGSNQCWVEKEREGEKERQLTEDLGQREVPGQNFLRTWGA